MGRFSSNTGDGSLRCEYSSYNDFFTDSDLIDKEFVLGVIPIELFENFNSQSKNDKCLEIKDKPIVRVTDEQAQKII